MVMQQGIGVSMIDTHVHTARFSKDSQLQIEELFAQLNNDRVCLCEHMDYGDYVKADKQFDIAQYFREYKKYHNKILLGIEIGMDLTYAEEIQALEKEPFDYILGSIHAFKGNNLYNNPQLYNMEKSLFYKAYFEYAVECIEKFNFIDAFAHFDYVSRYTTYPDPILAYDEFYEGYQTLFQALIRTGTLLEVNTKQIASKKNLLAVLQGYKEAGGQYVTLGSDAHNLHGVFHEFTDISKMIQAIGLEIVYFKKRELRKGAI